MADVWMDFPGGSPGLYGTNRALLLDGAYASHGETELVDDPDPNVTGNVPKLQTATGAGIALRKTRPYTSTEVGFAFRLWLAALPAPGMQSLCYTGANASGQALFTISVGPAGQIYVRKGTGSGAVIAESPLNTIVANAWQNVECLVVVGAAGSIEIQVEAVTKLDASPIDTQGAAGPCAMDYFEKINASPNHAYIKDYRLWDTSGGWGDTFTGTRQVIDLGPAGDVSSGWSKTVGASDAAILDNVPPDDDEYIYAPEDPFPAPSIVTLQNLPEDVTSVRTLMTIFRGSKSDGGDAFVQTALLSNGDADLGEDRPMTVAFTYWWDFSHLDPDTGAAWTPAAVDAATLQINRTL